MEEDKYWVSKQMDSLVGSLGSAFSDLNCVVCEQLNDNFALRNNLPQGKLVSDWLALAAGVRGFDLARSSGEAHLASFALAPCNGLPVNPFTGQKEDVDCLLEAMSGIASESFEAASRAAYSRLCTSRKYEVTPRELFSDVSAFNKSLESLMQAFDEDMPKPAPFKVTKSLLAASSVVKNAKKPKDGGKRQTPECDQKSHRMFLYLSEVEFDFVRKHEQSRFNSCFFQ
ncbi:hypothetical protein Esti_004855 [Eimeria stiedai]